VIKRIVEFLIVVIILKEFHQTKATLFDKKKYYVILVHCFNEGFLLKFDQLNFKLTSAIRRKCLPQLLCAHTCVMSRLQFRYNPFFCKPTIAVDQNKVPYLLITETKMDPTFFLTKGKALSVDQSSYSRLKHTSNGKCKQYFQTR